MHRLLFTALLLGGMVTTPAAHAELIASSPADNAALAAPPAGISLTFNEPVTLAGDPIEVVGPDDVTWRVGTPTIAGEVVRAPVTANGPAGEYTIVYRVVSGDGDPVSGSVRFRLTTATTTAPESTVPGPASAAPTGTTPAASDGGVLLWVWLLAGAVLLAALVFVTLRVRRPGR